MTKVEYTAEQIKHGYQLLNDLARQPRTRFTMQQSIAELLEPIQLALKTHTYEEVASDLKLCGIEIKPSTLKKYVTRCVRDGQPGTEPSNAEPQATDEQKIDSQTFNCKTSEQESIALDLPSKDNLENGSTPDLGTPESALSTPPVETAKLPSLDSLTIDQSENQSGMGESQEQEKEKQASSDCSEPTSENSLENGSPPTSATLTPEPSPSVQGETKQKSSPWVEPEFNLNRVRPKRDQ
ncbi:hypothetical protein IQ268_28615 [Oculatella sp. LEGE 06141]|uniref:hypothetical protein n=1 Tax=Oculatella sp. LEGE 06141 TaxID=1828648 RepID=UPI0018824A41|nr:hypothetical protein [Oculatella sp. LEGE 06141]MBE9182518.1 hypothetical protein [Oculatella sp. LEGE 06141]